MSFRILVVEDSIVNQTLARTILTNAGHTVTVASNGREAVAIVEANEFDFVLMDVQMPEMDGLTATRLIRESESKGGRRLPIVALTASEERGPCLDAGMDDFMTKPVRAVELLETVRRLSLSRDTAPDVASSDAFNDGMAAETNGPPVSILLIEDSPTAKLLVPKLLEKGIGGPYALDVRSTLAEGLARIREGGIDLVLLDLNLDDSVGLNTLQGLRKVDAKLPVIVLTGEDDEALSMTAVRSGAQDYLVKWRFNSESLTRAIQFTLERERWISETAGLTSSDSQRRYIARAIQRDLLPKESPAFENVDLHGQCEITQNVDSDFFDYLPMLRNSLGIAVGGVVAQGLRAVMKMVEIRAVIRSLVLTHGDVGYICSRAAEVIAPDLHLGESINLAFLRVDPQCLVQYVAPAGQTVLLDGRGGIKHELNSAVSPISSDGHDGVLEAASITVDPGDVLLIASRPLTQYRSGNGDQLSLGTLAESIAADREAPARVIVERLFQELYRRGGNHKLEHDISFVAARFNGVANREACDLASGRSSE